MAKQAVMYIRVSRDEQADKGGPEDQRRACLAYAEREGLEVAYDLFDDISGAIQLTNRPAGSKLLEMVYERRVEAVIFHRIDRIARDEEAYEYDLFKHECFKYGVEVHSAEKGQRGTSLDHRLIDVIDAYEAARERLKIKERTTAGRNLKAEREKRPVMNGYPPFGYKRKGKGDEAFMLIDEREADIVQSIFEWYTTGNGNGSPLSLRAIALKLEEIGVATPMGKSPASCWTPTTLRGIIKNEIYTGRTYYGKTRTINDKKIKQPREKWIEIDVPELAFIDQNTFDLAQKRLKRNKELATRNRKLEYLLSGFFRCGGCNGAMGGTMCSSKKNPYRVYRCGNLYYKPANARCADERHWVSARLVEGKAWTWLANLLEDDEKLNRGLREMEESKGAAIEPRQRRLEAIIEMVDKLELEIKRLARGVREASSDIVAEALQAEMNLAAKQREGLMSERQELEIELSEYTITPDVREQILANAAKIRQGLALLTYQEKRQMLDLLEFRAIFRRDDSGRWLDVSCVLKPEGDCIVLSHSKERPHPHNPGPPQP